MRLIQRFQVWLRQRNVVARELVPVPEWIKIDPYKGTAKYYWKVVDRVYYDPGNTIVYAYAEDENGNPKTNSVAEQSWPGGRATLRFEMKDGRAEATFPMTGDSSFDPKRNEAGPYKLQMFGQSDTVIGIGLPLKQHVELHVTFRWTLNEAQPPAPPPSGDYVTHAELDAAMSQIPLLVKQAIVAQWQK